MTSSARQLVSLAIACLLAAPGCVGGGSPVTPKPTRKPATKSPGPDQTPAFVTKQLSAVSSLEKLLVPQQGQAATLTGKAKIISDNGGGLISDNGGSIISDNGGSIISDNGGGIISNNTGGLLSNNGGSLISDNGGGLISNNGGGLTAKTKYGLAQSPQLAVYALAEAVITLHDAAGRVLVDEAGKPLMATTGKDGGYKLEATLPPGNLIAKIRLWNGGELAAMVVRDGAGGLTLDLDTASTMGAAYVLGQFVKGDQKVFDKLPRSENERLTRELDVVRSYLTSAFKYDERVLTDAADALRKRVPAVDKTIEDVKALLIGQGRIGGGRPATQVALADPIGMLVRKSGALLVAERFPGRVRTIDGKGLLETFLDGAFGQYKANYPTLTDLAEGPDGSVYVCSIRMGHVFRLAPDGAITPVAGTGFQKREAVGAPLQTPMVPRSLAVGPDGTLYIGENRGDGDVELIPPRLYAIKDGQLSQVPGAAFEQGNLNAVAVAPDGTIYVLHQLRGKPGTLFKLAGGTLTPLATDLACGDEADMVRAADGTLYVAEERGGRVTAIAPDGTKKPVALPTGADALRVPCGLGIGPDGTLYVADQSTALVHARDAAGAWRVVAGTQAATQQGDVTSFAISLPGGATLDADGNLLVAEGGSHTIKRFRNGKLEIFAGGLRGEGGDGGQASQAQLYAPTGITNHEGAIWVLDTGNRALRRIGPDGVITTRAGGSIGKKDIPVGTSVPQASADLSGGVDIAFGPDGHPYWTSQATGQVWRLRPSADGDVVEGILGRSGGGISSQLDFGAVMAAGVDPDPAKSALHFPFGLAFDKAGNLYVSDSVACQIQKVTAPGTPQARTEVFAGVTVAEVFAAAAAVGPDAPVPTTDGLKARDVGLIIPGGMVFDGAGNMYVAEAGTANIAALTSVFNGRFPIDPALFPRVPARIRRIAPDGTITTVAGPGGKFFKDPTAEDALALPTSLSIDKAGRLVIVDSGANLIRILPAGSY